MTIIALFHADRSLRAATSPWHNDGRQRSGTPHGVPDKPVRAYAGIAPPGYGVAGLRLSTYVVRLVDRLAFFSINPLAPSMAPTCTDSAPTPVHVHSDTLALSLS
jgi:hypothetical protein